MNIVKFTIISCLILLTASRTIYDHTKSPVYRITKLNFEKQVNQIRSKTKMVTIVHYYKSHDESNRDFARDFEGLASDYQGVFQIGGVDCVEDMNLCEKEKITKYPLVRIYPTQPIPAFDHEGEMTSKSILSAAAKYLQNNVVSVTSANIDTFINENPSVPKVLLFTDKKGIPTIYKGLSISFDKKLFLGIVRKDDDTLCDRYNVNEFPKIIVIKITQKKPIPYKGEMKYKPIFEFLNIYSEAFVPGGGSSQDSAATKAWLTEVAPELNQKSANDICLKIEGGLCVMVLSEGKPSKEQHNVLKQVHKNWDRKISRGSQFKFMWLDVSKEAGWGKLFKIEEFPKIVVFNPGKRKRYLTHEGNIDIDSLQNTLERVNGGDARFTPVKGDLPEFSMMKD